MPRVRMKTSVANRNYAIEENETADVSPDQAQAWVAAGIAEYVTGEPIQTPERRMNVHETRRRSRNAHR